jgi:hypothetical protein
MRSIEKPAAPKVELYRPGVLSFHGMRAAILDLEAGYWNMRASLESLIGKHLTQTVLQQSGVAAGAAMTRALQPAGSSEEMLRDCLAAYQAAGFGCFELEQLDLQSGYATIKAIDTADAWLAARHEEDSAHHACHYTTGFLLGAMQAAAGRQDLVCCETTCQTRGDSTCQFELLPLEAAGSRPVITGKTDPTMGSELNLLEILFERTPLGIAVFDPARPSASTACRLPRAE